ncbi:sulfur carrier protein ThiS [Buchnera aphidicola]|uniref:sulfur carrier protein ThiS n=1 Tax=Buchnera aphidicola TaxID=9 RepID=UPI0034648C28
MKITVNEKELIITSSLILSELIEQFPIYLKNSAISVNNNIIPKKNWKKYTLKNNDKIILFHIIAGG